MQEKEFESAHGGIFRPELLRWLDRDGQKIKAGPMSYLDESEQERRKILSPK